MNISCLGAETDFITSQVLWDAFSPTFTPSPVYTSGGSFSAPLNAPTSPTSFLDDLFKLPDFSIGNDIAMDASHSAFSDWLLNTTPKPKTISTNAMILGGAAAIAILLLLRKK